MERKPDDRDTTREPVLPHELAQDLAALYGAKVPVPPRIEARILAHARSRFAGRRRRAVWRLGAAASAAAAVMVACVLLATLGRRDEDATAPMAALSEPPAAARKEDLDHNGTVNIVDAMLLARRIESSARLESGWDVNGDGAVDRSDVDAIAMTAVRLEGG